MLDQKTGPRTQGDLVREVYRLRSRAEKFETLASQAFDRAEAAEAQLEIAQDMLAKLTPPAAGRLARMAFRLGLI